MSLVKTAARRSPFLCPRPNSRLLDRSHVQRRDAEFRKAMRSRPDARILVLKGESIAVTAAGDLAFLPGPVSKYASSEDESNVYFLGVAPREPANAPDAGLPYFVAGPEIIPSDAKDIEFSPVRYTLPTVSHDEAIMVGYAKCVLDWHNSAKHCGYCGARTLVRELGQSRKCSVEACGQDVYPRTNPVMIALVVSPDNQRVLLGQSRGRQESMKLHSLLAGFVDQLESVHDAVRREVKEESGVDVGHVWFHSSQPWPMPSNLMLGCIAVATTENIVMDPTEMADVRWVTRDEVRKTLDFARSKIKGDKPEGAWRPQLNLPGPIAIAHTLLGQWAAGQLDEDIAWRRQGKL